MCVCSCVFFQRYFKHTKRLNILYSFFSPFVHKWCHAIHTVFHLDFYLIFILETSPYQFIEFLFFFNIWIVLHYVDVIIYLTKALLMDTGLFPVVSYPKQYCFEKPSSLCISLTSKHILRSHKQVPGFSRYTAGVWSLAPPGFKPQQLCVLEPVTQLLCASGFLPVRTQVIVKIQWISLCRLLGKAPDIQ